MFVLALCGLSMTAQILPERREIYRGNDKFNQGNLDDAILEYKKALQIDSLSYAANYNMGNACYKAAMATPENEQEARQLQLVNALKYLDKAAQVNKTFEVEFNKGNVHMQLQDYAQAVDAYREALLLNPGDMDAKMNYIYARKKQQEQQDQQNNQDNQNQDQNQNQNQDQNQDNNQNKDNQQDNKDQDSDKNNDKNQDDKNNPDQNKDNKNQDSDKDKNRNQDNQDNKNQPQDQPQGQPQPQPGKMSQAQAEQILQAMSDKEKKTQEKVKEAQAVRAGAKDRDKNW